MTKTVTLGETATFVNGYPFKPTDWKKEGLPIIRIQDLTGNAYETNYFNGTVPAKYYVHDGDILISWSASLGIYEWQRGDAVLNQHIFKVVFDKLKVDKQYFRHVVGYKLNVMASLTHGATMKHITKGDFDNMPIPLPPLSEQRRIAALLDRADALRQKDRQLLAHYDKLAQSLFLNLFGDPVKNEKGWEVKPVISNSDCIVPGRDKPKSFTGETPWVTTDDLKHLGFTDKSKKSIGLSFKEIKEVNARVVPAESVIMTCVGDLGIISIAKKDMVVNQQLHAFQCNRTLNNIFLMYNLSYRKDYMVKMASSTTVPYMNKTVCNSVPIILPPLALQTHFAQLMEQIERQKAVVRQQMAASEGLFGRLLQESFT